MRDLDDEALLVALLSGERAADDPEVLAAFAARPELRGRLQRLQGLAARLDLHGEEARGLLASSSTTRSPHECLVQPFVEQRSSRYRRHWAWLVAAALALLGVWLLSEPFKPGAADRSSMLELRPGDLWPNGQVASFGHFRWQLAVPAQGSYVVRVRAADDGNRELSAHRTVEPEWRPSREVHANWPARILWEVEIRDASDRPTAVVGPVLAWRP